MVSDKDYAQSSTAQVESKKASQASNPKPIFVATLGTMLAIVCFSVGFYLGERYNSESNQGEKYEALLAKLQAQQEENKNLKIEATKFLQQQNDTDVGELTFYQELPKQSVVPEPLVTKNSLEQASKPAVKIHPATPNTQQQSMQKDDEIDLKATEEHLNAIIAEELSSSTYKFRIQVASFIHEKDAETLVKQLKSIDIDANIKEVSLKKIGVRYRVYTAPFNQEKKAIRAQQLIQEMFGVKGIIYTQ